MIKITLNDTKAVQSLEKIAKQLQHPKQLYGVLGETLKKIHRERFKQEVSPEGEKWQTLSKRTKTLKAKRGKSLKILRQDGYLSDNTAYNYDDRQLEFGSSRIYARIHHFGGKAGRGRKVNIPARPWLGTNEKDNRYLLDKAEQHLAKVIAKIR